MTDTMMTAIAAFSAVWPKIFLFDLLRYGLAAGGFSLFIYSTKTHRLAGRRIQSRTAKKKDIRREITQSLMTVLVFSLFGYGVYTGIDKGLFTVYGAAGEYSLFYTLISLPLLIILHDAYFYWAHRSLHHPPLFKRLHSLHHKSRTPTPWTAYAFNLGEAVVQALFLPLVLLVLPLHHDVIFLFLLVMITRNVMLHAGYELHPKSFAPGGPFSWLTTTTHHDMHHESGHYNFGFYFTFWDQIMKTEHPAYGDRLKEIYDRQSHETAISKTATGAKG